MAEGIFFLRVLPDSNARRSRASSGRASSPAAASAAGTASATGCPHACWGSSPTCSIAPAGSSPRAASAGERRAPRPGLRRLRPRRLGPHRRRAAAPAGAQLERGCPCAMVRCMKYGPPWLLYAAAPWWIEKLIECRRWAVAGCRLVSRVIAASVSAFISGRSSSSSPLRTVRRRSAPASSHIISHGHRKEQGQQSRIQRSGARTQCIQSEDG